MKQLEKVQLQDAKELTQKQMKDIAGDSPTSGNVCQGYPQSQCNGGCIDSDTAVSGTCVWVSAWDRCACATISVG